MEKKVTRVYALIPLLYLGIILLLLFLQFSGGEILNEVSGSLNLRGSLTTAAETEEERIARISLDYGGLVFQFNGQDTLELQTANGAVRALEVTGYNSVDSGFELFFERDVSLLFESEDAENSLEVTISLPENLLNEVLVIIPVGLERGIRVREQDNSPVVAVQRNDADYSLILPPRSAFDSTRNAIVMPAAEPTQSFTYTRAEAAEAGSIASWFQAEDLEVSSAAFRSEVSTFIDRAYTSWSTTRLNPAAGTWQMPDGTTAFDEALATAYLAEAWVRDDYPRAFTTVRSAADDHPDQLTELSAVYLGNLREVTGQMLAADQRETVRLSDLLAERDPAVFRTRGLAKFATDNAGGALLEELLAFVESVDLSQLQTRDAIGALDNYFLADLPTEDIRESFARFEPLVDLRLVPAIRKTSEGFFLETEEGRSEVIASLLSGLVLEAAGLERGDTQLTSMGRQLVLSVLDLSDQNGFLPRFLILRGSAIVDIEGTLGPEDLYVYLHENPAYPRQVSFYREIGPGSYMLTVAELTGRDISDSRYEISIRSPANRTHYILMQGIRPFARLELFGLTWRNDPNFELYVKGRHYNRQTQTLMIKHTDANPEQDIVVAY
jgi:hypothetical protein